MENTYNGGVIQFTSFYVTNPIDRKARRVVAAFQDLDTDDDTILRRVAFAVTNPQDAFDRKRGQMIAEARLLQREKTFIIESNTDKSKRIFNNIDSTYIESNDDTMMDAYRRALWTRWARTAAGGKKRDLIKTVLETGAGLRNPDELPVA